jgi:hypothetical protein
MENRISDCLSRWSQHEKFKDDFFQLTTGFYLEYCEVVDQDFVFINDW